MPRQERQVPVLYYPPQADDAPCAPTWELRNRPPGPAIEAGRTSRKVLLTQNYCHDLEILADFPWQIYHAFADVRDRWADIERSHRKAGDFGRAAYAHARRRTLRTPVDERMRLCGTRKRVVRCDCRHVRIPVDCGVRALCERCATKFAARKRRKMRRNMRAWERAHTACWIRDGRPKRARPRWQLITLTVRHSGDLALDRQRLQRGWEALRKYWWRALGSAPPFALCWEVTPGRDRLGHVHIHAAALLPWVDYREMHRIWRGAVPESEQMHVSVARKGATYAAEYVAKYVGKVSHLGDFSPVLTARVMRMMYNKRAISTSRRFWVREDSKPRCKCCGAPWEMVARPPPMLRDHGWTREVQECGFVELPRPGPAW